MQDELPPCKICTVLVGVLEEDPTLVKPVRSIRGVLHYYKIGVKNIAKICRGLMFLFFLYGEPHTIFSLYKNAIQKLWRPKC